MAISGAYFDVLLVGTGAVLAGDFLAVSGLDMEADYEVYTEGGSSYPRFFFKNVKPQHLVLEKGVVTTIDSVSLLMSMVNLGMSIPLAGTIILKDSFGTPKRTWTIVGAYLQKYVGPQLNSNQASVAVSRIELIHNGCF
ncbi:phage tail protein [uncultured Flavonifractor sp.]|uniref:phage tail protein n=1 Tax=uncultured Flavonifractor sp. TaxID=1193534 RepID=UPI00260EE94B|nr:phage tail protein [uncultured Flavonifractor sp.]